MMDDTTTRPAPLEPDELAPIASLGARVRESVTRVVVGRDDELRACLVAVLAGGHVLLEGPPGTAKTLLVRALAAALGGVYGRVQFTPDLMPSDVVGTSVFHRTESRFDFRPGPVFANVLLCDEINRAPAKTQAALLEAMQEHAVTVDGERHALPDPFFVCATQNPREHEGTYPLPEAQLDRFLLHVRVGYPARELEVALLRLVHGRPLDVDPAHEGIAPVTDPSELARLVALVRRVEVRDDLCGYVADLCAATREDPALVTGASPRAGVMLLAAAKATAALDGRAFVRPDDVKAVAVPALRHRLELEPAEELAGATTDDVVGQLLDRIEVPR